MKSSKLLLFASAVLWTSSLWVIHGSGLREHENDNDILEKDSKFGARSFPVADIFDLSSEPSISREIQDYCETDTFEAECPDNDVIMMTSARYGRMKIGRCVKKDLGYIGCSADVLGLADQKCSGRQTCMIRIPDPDMDSTKPCLEELKTYLEASYRCITVEQPFRRCDEEESSRWVITKSSGGGFLSSTITSDTHCGTEYSPIRLSAWAGQRLNITVYDFSHSAPQSLDHSDPRSHLDPRSLSGASPPAAAAAQGKQDHEFVPAIRFGSGAFPDQECGHFVMLFDPDVRRKVKVCPGVRRVRNVYVSSNRSLDLYFKRVSSSTGVEYRLLVQFTVLGCADFRPQDDMWVSKSETEAEIGCRSTDQKWRLKCVNNRWVGEVGNCTKSSPLGIVIHTDEPSLSHGAAIAIVLCVALLMGIIILVVGAIGLLLKRFQKRMMRRPGDTFRPDVIKTSASGAASSQTTIEYGVTGGLPDLFCGNEDCKYTECVHCSCPDQHLYSGSYLISTQPPPQNNYVPIRVSTATPGSVISGDTFGTLPLSSFRRVVSTGGKFSTISEPGKSNLRSSREDNLDECGQSDMKTELVEGMASDGIRCDQHRVTEKPEDNSLPPGMFTELEESECSCSGNLIGMDGRFPFWNSLSNSAYCPVFNESTTNSSNSNAS